MAATLAGARLTEAHRLAQTSLGARVMSEQLLLWSLIDPKRLDATTLAWLEASLALLQVRRIESANLAASYLRAFRTIEAPQAATVAPVVAAQLDLAAASTSLEVVGPVSIKRAMRAGTDIAKAAERAGTNTARAAMRHTLDGGRSTVAATAAADPESRGFRRVTSGSACGFCSALANKGAVFTEGLFAAHDGCSCSAEPAYGGTRQQVRQYVARDLTPAQRAESNRRIREWVASET